MNGLIVMTFAELEHDCLMVKRLYDKTEISVMMPKYRFDNSRGFMTD